jgi:phosphinothricin acetyltransferase
MSLVIDLAARADVEPSLRFANWAAEHTTANFALSPEPLAQWEAEYDKNHAQHPWLVARESGTVIGFARASPHKSRGAYAWAAEVGVYIDPAHHRRGVGRALYRVLIPLLRAQSFVTLIAGITTGHEGSERLHASFGFTRCATFHRMGFKFGAWHDVSYWELQLGGDGEPAPLVPVRAAWAPRAR